MPVRTLPTEADKKEIETALANAFDLLERHVKWAISEVDKGDHDAYPHAVTYEQMGVLADIRAYLNMRMGDFREISQAIDDTMFDFGAIIDMQRRRNGGNHD